MPALVVATLALHLWKTKTPGWENIDTLRIGGVGIGWKPWQVIDVLGTPKSKSGDMASGAFVLADFVEISVTFSRGVVTEITEFIPKKGTNFLGADQTAEAIVQLYGKPKLVIRPKRASGLQADQWLYPNGVKYTVEDGIVRWVDVSRSVWDTFQRPDWGIKISDSSGTTQAIRRSTSFESSVVKGIIQNDRESKVSVVLRVTWTFLSSGKAERLADVYDSRQIEINAHDDTVFTVTGGSFLRPLQGDNLVYEVKVKSVEEL
jgi:hypothetical protein